MLFEYVYCGDGSPKCRFLIKPNTFLLKLGTRDPLHIIHDRSSVTLYAYLQESTIKSPSRVNFERMLAT